MIPSLRETITQLVYKVRAALEANNCMSGYWAGNLKNKDLNGDEILSQVRNDSLLKMYIGKRVI